jgi:hypothetical protein
VRPAKERSKPLVRVPTAKIPLLCASLGVGIRQLLRSRRASALKNRLAGPSHSRTGEKAARVEYPIDRRSIEVAHSCVPTTFLANQRCLECVRPRGAFTVIRNPWGRRDRQEREGSVWWPAVVGAINFDGLIVLDIAIELFGRR